MHSGSFDSVCTHFLPFLSELKRHSLSSGRPRGSTGGLSDGVARSLFNLDSLAVISV